MLGRALLVPELRPGIPQRHRAVEHQRAGTGIDGIADEEARPLELVARPGRIPSWPYGSNSFTKSLPVPQTPFSDERRGYWCSRVAKAAAIKESNTNEYFVERLLCPLRRCRGLRVAAFRVCLCADHRLPLGDISDRVGV